MQVNPRTTVGSSKVKEELETTQLYKFDHDVICYKIWFEDIWIKIIQDEGPGRYNKYLINLFRGHLICSDSGFVEVVTDKRRIWIQGKL